MSQPDSRENLSRRETIDSLRRAIDRLDTVVSQLNTGAVESLPSQEEIDALLATTGRIAASLATLPRPESTPGKKDKALEESAAGAVPEGEDPGPRFEKKKFPGDTLLDRLRTTLLVGGAVISVLLGGVFLLKNLPEIASGPASTLGKEVPREIEAPPELKAPDVALPVPMSEPAPKLTPEQNLVAGIQEEMGQLTARYPEGLISTVEADFFAGRLRVFVGDSWYGLNPAQQDKFVDSIHGRASRLDFRRLEIEDTSGVLVARSPVVGDRVVILERTR